MRRAHRKLIDRKHQPVPLLRGPGYVGIGQPQDQFAKPHQQFIERPVEPCKLIHRTTPSTGVMNGPADRSPHPRLGLTGSERWRESISARPPAAYGNRYQLSESVLF